MTWHGWWEPLFLGFAFGFISALTWAVFELKKVKS